jgi:hypothetical protein
VTFPLAEWRLIEARVDYWSGTTAEEREGNDANDRARELVETERLGELRSSGQSIQGYAGVASDHVFTGQSERGTFIRLSSATADQYWLEFIGKGLRTSRIDCCVTLQASRDVRDVAYSIRYGDRLPTRGRGKPAQVGFHSTDTGGDTAYIGSPASDRRGRVYDKGRESPTTYALGAWRWEVQSRHVVGDHVGTTLSRRDDAPKWIAAFVYDYFVERGIPAPWTPGLDHPLDPVREEPSTDVGRYNYLKTSIRPMIEKLKARYSLHELREACGLLFDVNETTHTKTSARKYSG